MLKSREPLGGSGGSADDVAGQSILSPVHVVGLSERREMEMRGTGRFPLARFKAAKNDNGGVPPFPSDPLPDGLPSNARQLTNDLRTRGAPCFSTAPMHSDPHAS